MTYPNPAGYYSLKLPESVEEAIQVLESTELITLIHSLIYHLGEGKDDRFYCFIPFTPSSLDDAIDKLSRKDKISLIRWTAELLAAKNNEA